MYLINNNIMKPQKTRTRVHGYGLALRHPRVTRANPYTRHGSPSVSDLAERQDGAVDGSGVHPSLPV